MLYIGKIQYRMRLWDAREEASAVKEYGRKYAQHTQNTM